MHIVDLVIVECLLSASKQYAGANLYILLPAYSQPSAELEMVTFNAHSMLV